MAIHGEWVDIEIPDPVSIAGWKEVAIEESGQPLIDLGNLDPLIQVVPQYFGVKQQLAGIIARKHHVHRFAL